MGSIRTITSRARVIGYVRVSTADQGENGVGLEAQRQIIEAEVARRGWELVGSNEDIASGKSTNGRHGLSDALEVIERGGADGLIVAKLDRLSRSLADFASLMERSRRQGWILVAVDLGVDTSTPSGELLSTVVASVAQYERRLIGQRTREALAVKRAQGVRLGRPRVVAEAVVQRVRRLRRSGRSFAAIAATLNAQGVPSPLGPGGTAPPLEGSLSRSSERRPPGLPAPFHPVWEGPSANRRPPRSEPYLTSGNHPHANLRRQRRW